MKIILIFFLAQISQYQAQLDSLKAELKKLRSEKQKLEKDEEETLQYLSKLNEEYDVLTTFIKTTSREIQAVKKEKKELVKTIEETENYLENSRDKIRKAIITFYKLGDFNPLTIFLTANSPYAFYSGLKAINRGLSDERYILQRGVILLRKLHSGQQILKEKEKKLSFLIETFTKREEEILRIRSEKREFLENVRTKKNKREKIIAQLKAQMNKLDKIVKELERKRLETLKKYVKKPLPERDLMWPLRGKVVSSFGSIWHPKYKTRIKNNGIDIEAKLGEPVRAVDNGIVEYANEFLGYGKLVLINHGDGLYSIYGYMQRIFVTPGTPLEKGRIIGEVGMEPLEDKSVLHFELRYGGEPVDPLLLLVEVSS